MEDPTNFVTGGLSATRAAQREALRAASENANRLNLVEAVSQMANNPELAKAAGLAATMRRKQYTPEKMGTQGFMLPESGDFVESPMYVDEKNAARDARQDALTQTLQQRRDADAQRMAHQRELQQGRIDAQMERDSNMHALRLTIAGMRGGGSGSGKGANGKVLPAGEVRRLSAQEGVASAFADLSDSFKPEYSGTPMLAGVQNTIGKYTSMGGYEAQSNWWQNYNEQVNKVRNELFGSALTKTEKDAFEKATITEGMSPLQIQLRLSQQHAAATRAYNKLKNKFGGSGYDMDGFAELEEPKTMLPGGESPRAAPAKVAAGDKPRGGVDPKVWSFMTPEQKALFK